MVAFRLIALANLAGFGTVFAGSNLARGWGETIKWTTLDDAKVQAKRSSKPLMIVVHKKQCPVCNELKPNFAVNSEIQNLSRHFLMVNLENEEVPNTKDFTPDGVYVPRIMFYGPDCKLIKDVHSSDKAKRFLYSEANDIADNMRQVLNEFSY
ncbi:unnamed protein product [Lymnaea stagnalis]|uniref:Thioredoxin domain-containing protein 12 n=1 Tax=Lymnaea stagnalis TaxID=6523 RepID=A0AAV2I066_LYMST